MADPHSSIQVLQTETGKGLKHHGVHLPHMPGSPVDLHTFTWKLWGNCLNRRQREETTLVLSGSNQGNTVSIFMRMCSSGDFCLEAMKIWLISSWGGDRLVGLTCIPVSVQCHNSTQFQKSHLNRARNSTKSWSWFMSTKGVPALCLCIVIMKAVAGSVLSHSRTSIVDWRVSKEVLLVGGKTFKF